MLLEAFNQHLKSYNNDRQEMQQQLDTLKDQMNTLNAQLQNTQRKNLVCISFFSSFLNKGTSFLCLEMKKKTKCKPCNGSEQRGEDVQHLMEQTSHLSKQILALKSPKRTDPSTFTLLLSKVCNTQVLEKRKKFYISMVSLSFFFFVFMIIGAALMGAYPSSFIIMLILVHLHPLHHRPRRVDQHRVHCPL